VKTIILSGKSGSGKDMFALFLKQELDKVGKKTIIIHYADALKWLLKEYYNWNGEKDQHGRTLLQQVGTDKVRTYAPDYWTAIVVGFLGAIAPYNDFDVAIIPDARFENEITLPQQLLDVVTARIERTNSDGTPWENPALTKEQLQHPSETSLDDFGFDYIIHNDEGVEQMKDAAWALLNDLKEI